MASIFDDPENLSEINRYFSRATRGQSPLGQSFMTGSWFRAAPSLTMGQGGLMPQAQREYAQKIDIEEQKRDREQQKVRALAQKHPEIKGMPFETMDEAMAYLRYLKSGQGWGFDVPELPITPVAPEDQRLKGYNVGGFLGGSKVTPRPIQPVAPGTKRLLPPEPPKIAPPQTGGGTSGPQTKTVAGKMYVKNQLGQWVIAR